MDKKKRIWIVLIIVLIVGVVLGGWRYGEYRYVSGHTVGYYEGYDKGKEKGYENGYAAARRDYGSLQATNERDYNYIANKKTRKFHLPSCPSVAKMSGDNKLCYNGTREHIIAEGYTPCERCNP